MKVENFETLQNELVKILEENLNKNRFFVNFKEEMIKLNTYNECEITELLCFQHF